MEIRLSRVNKGSKSTIGELYIDNIFFCNTLEDTDRGIKQSDTLASILETKVMDETAIPTGRYQVIMDMSTRFQRIMPHILNVPGFEGVRIHGGNSDVDTDGCVLLGTFSGSNDDWISNSAVAVAKFYPKLQEGLKNGSVYINII